jgi:hypothetical protein
MQYETLLRLALVPSIVFFLLSLVSVILTTHYWLLGDWIITRWVKVITSEVDERTKKNLVDDVIVWYTEKDTNVTIASGCLCLTAAIIALIAWSTLRKPDMDSQLSAVCTCHWRCISRSLTVLQGKRRFWVLAVVFTTLIGAATALSSLVLHFTQQGDNEYGCTTEHIIMQSRKKATNQVCTREMGACNFLSRTLSGSERQNALIACNEAVSTSRPLL